MENIADAIAFEVKKEIAERYFGTRRRIEEETGHYLRLLTESSADYSARIGKDLQRLRLMFDDEVIFRDVLFLIDLPEEFYLKCQEIQPESALVLLKNFHGRGLTRVRRYRDLVHKTYRALTVTVEEYRTNFADLAEMHEEICREISEFERRNDLSGILGFFRDFDRTGNWRASVLQGEIPLSRGMDLGQDLRLHPPPPVTEVMPPLPAPVPLEASKSRFDQLLNAAYASHRDDFRRTLPC
jgi:hypothetical protein